MNDTIIEIESELSFVEEGLDALGLLMDNIELEGFQYPECFDDNKAILFSRQFPSYFSAFNVVLRDLNTRARAMHEAIAAEYEEKRAG